MKNEAITYETKLGVKVYTPGCTACTIRAGDQDLKEGDEDRKKIEIQDQARRQERDN